jgi:ATP-dependent Clp protease ATP-binding subunit ClpA
MFEEYSRETENVFIMAGYEAERLRDDHTGTEHVLLAILEEDDCGAARAPKTDPAAKALKELGLSASAVRKTIETHEGTSEQSRPVAVKAPERTRPITGELGQCLRSAREGRDNVMPVHLLVAIFNRPRGAATEVVQRLGIAVSAVRDELATVAGGAT